MTHASVLIVDDEKNILSTLSRALRVEDYDVDVAGNAEIALRKVGSKAYDLLLLDVQLPDQDGLSILRQLREQQNDVPVIMMSGHGTIETAVQATQLGAYTFLEKPIGSERLLLAIQNCLGYARLAAENEELKERAGATDELLGESPVMQALRERIALAANANANVLVTGERGTGKELVARAIHLGSKRAGGPYEKLNCAAVPAELIESELFGHEAGAFTGATKQRRGKFERAAGGTLFLDEVGDMPASMQAKLLRVLQEGELERVGGSDLIHVDVRVVAATNKALRAEIEEGRFRADLYDRLNVLPIRVPALRERVEDVPLLAAHFLRQACASNDRRGKSLTDGAMKLLTGYDYPGNVRELRNLIERLVILTPGDEVNESDARALLPIAGGGGGGGGYYRPGMPLKEMMEAVERDLITRALQHHEGHVTNTAADLGLERSHLYKKMKALDIKR
ncbi:MAG: Fis family transcriptional regulator [Sandaracinus sp.]|nr:Fis family transcriptional regulator [Sandaracinus sp.]HJK90763.1 sigma-54 dependent transcriptional regulator [Polyangiaceae bacterium LLY-WYZ-15_(1-7)]MBJ74868.1 Fis family transcriptional regulator [Sandaracinus sp.]HJL25937.1 sigma-54 dependent transcriptional regulator [Polyangiaceae bacterium LLY-WYZ-15_(1-7)]HJL29501.1 sigma-54 dependent transcriptional regulator [Polyangiaceae bacterium LLY-WYZ-15_(1-7)]